MHTPAKLTPLKSNEYIASTKSLAPKQKMII